MSDHGSDATDAILAEFYLKDMERAANRPEVSDPTAPPPPPAIPDQGRRKEAFIVVLVGAALVVGMVLLAGALSRG